MTDPTERFIRLFETLAVEVNRKACLSTSHAFEVARAAELDSAVRQNRALLVYIRDIRNLLQHPKHRHSGYAVHVSEDFVTEVAGLLTYLQNPPKAGGIGVGRKQITTAALTDHLGELAGLMKREGFSHVPIVDENDVVTGVFNEAAVFDHLWAEEETIISRQTTVADIFNHCALEADHTETFRFVKPSALVVDLTKLFRNVQSPKQRIGAVFVTASGNKNGALQRMITPWDIMTETGQ